MSLAETIEDQAYEAAFWMLGVFEPDYPVEALGELSYEVSTRLRTIAISLLVGEGKTDAFYHNLIRSGHVRITYLHRSLSAGRLDDHYRASGWYLPLCDAIAAGDMDGAREIAKASPRNMIAGHEYEDDYCYAQIMQSLLVEDAEHCHAVLRQFEKYLGGEASARFEIGSALISGDQARFTDGFENLIVERQREITRNIERGQFEAQDIRASRLIFVEGLALLRLAEEMKLKTEAEYLFCPSIARVPMVSSFPGDPTP